MDRRCFVAFFLCVSTFLLAMHFLQEKVSPSDYSPRGLTRRFKKICKEPFHYGVFDLPLLCRFQMSPVANLETDLALPNEKVYKEVEYLSVDAEDQYFGSHINSQNRSMIQNDTTISSSDVAFSNLYPAVIECFAIILCGYVAGRGNLISQTEAKGLNVFVGSFSLPALIFLSMAKLDFSSVNWLFLSSVFLAKTSVFFLVVLITLLIYRPTDFSRAGLYAIFCTQSNDFALGYPIVAALYSRTHPEYASYMYLVAPISLMVLNPIGFLLMEIGKRRQKDHENNEAASTDQIDSSCTLCLITMKELMLNPFVFMTALGIASNYIFNHNLPVILEGILKVLGQAFSASALFLLGLSMVGKVQNLRGASLVAPGILIAVKTLMLPIVTREMVNLLKPGANGNETSDYSNFGFLYGTFPTAPGVFVFASKYHVAVDMIASAMVACTFLSAPFMFISAKMVTLVSINPFEYVKELELFLLHVSIIGLICSLWVLLVFILTRKWRKVPHFITLCLTFSQFIACIGAMMWSVMDCNHTWKLYLQFIFFTFGVFSSRLWTAILALTLFLLRWRSLYFVLKLRPYLAVIGWGLPLVLVLSLIVTVNHETDLANKHDPNFQYGSAQAIVALLLLWFSLVTTAVCLILHQRFEKKYAHYESLYHSYSAEGDDGDSPPHEVRSCHSPDSTQGFLMSQESDESLISSTETLEISPSTSSLHHDQSLFSYNENLFENGGVPSSEHRRETSHRQVANQLTEPEEVMIIRDRDDEFQIMRHIVLLLFLLGSMIVGFSLCLWTLISHEVNGIYVELVFLDVVLNFGQGFFTVVIFGLDSKLIITPFMKVYRRLLYGAPTINLPPMDRLDSKTKQICEQFTTYHMDKCMKDIVRDRQWRLQHLSAVFAGTELVDWLLMVGLAHDRTDAVKYGRRLLLGRIIRHTEKLHNFEDEPLFYCFYSHPTSS